MIYKIFVLCPAYETAGGIELLHQLVYKINEINENCAVIYYNDYNQLKNDCPTPEIYKKYTGGKYVTQIIDDKKSILILPEVATDYITKFTNINVVLWWLSVDNFYFSLDRINKVKINSKIAYRVLLKFKVFKFINYFSLKPYYLFDPFKKKILFNKRVILHAYQSEYSKFFLEKFKLNPILPLSDFLNSIFFQDSVLKSIKEDIILYYPKKGFSVTKELIAFMPDYSWIPLENLTSAGMKSLMNKAKIYIDFGYHPGKDRIPREAAINGCVVITNKVGSAFNDIDIPIDKKYKFENPIMMKNDFKNLVDNIFLDFDKHFSDFDSYRTKIENEEILFENELLAFYKFLENYLKR